LKILRGIDETDETFSHKQNRPFDGSQTQKFSKSVLTKMGGLSTYDTTSLQKQMNDLNTRAAGPFQTPVVHENNFTESLGRSEYSGARNRYDLGTGPDLEFSSEKDDFRCEFPPQIIL